MNIIFTFQPEENMNLYKIEWRYIKLRFRGCDRPGSRAQEQACRVVYRFESKYVYHHHSHLLFRFLRDFNVPCFAFNLVFMFYNQSTCAHRYLKANIKCTAMCNTTLKISIRKLTTGDSPRQCSSDRN